jgi:hypothetical protein
MSVKKQVSLHGLRAFLSPNDDLVAKGTHATGGEGKPTIILPGSPDYVATWDDFVDTGNIAWTSLEGDTGNSQGSQAFTNGVWRLTMGDTLTAAPSNVNVFNQRKIWKANQSFDAKYGRLRMGARVKIGTVSRDSPDRVSVFVGFTDTGGTEMPLYDTGGGLVTVAADAVGIAFGSRGDTGWWAASAKSTAGDSGDGGPVVLDTTTTTNVWDVLEIEVHRGISDTGGTATFYVNGIPKGTIISPVNTATALIPVIAMFQEDTGGGNTLDIDWVNVSAPRDTGT